MWADFWCFKNDTKLNLEEPRLQRSQLYIASSVFAFNSKLSRVWVILLFDCNTAKLSGNERYEHLCITSGSFGVFFELSTPQYVRTFSVHKVRENCQFLKLTRDWVSTGAKSVWHPRNFWTVMSRTRWFWQFYYLMLCCTLEFWGFTSDWHLLCCFKFPTQALPHYYSIRSNLKKMDPLVTEPETYFG